MINEVRDNYPKQLGSTHVLIKLAEECNELSQATLKILDKIQADKPISQDIKDNFWEEMAHVLIFWDMANAVMGHDNLLHSYYEERILRMSLKLKANEKDK